MDVTPPPHSKIIKQQKGLQMCVTTPPPPYNPWTRVCARGQTCICTVNDICFNFFIELYYILLLLLYIPPSPPTQHPHCITKPPFPQSEPPSPAPPPPTP